MSPHLPSWEPLSEAVLVDQLGTYDRMRSTCPVAASPLGVTLFRHADVVAAANDPERFSSSVTARRSIPNSIDPPEHTSWRRLIDPFFTAQRMARLEPRVRTIAESLVASLPRSTTIDAVTDIGQPMAVRAQTEWLGWQGTEHRLLAWMAQNHAATRSGDRARAAAAASAFDEIIGEQIARRRRPGDAAPQDPTTELVDAKLDGMPLDTETIVSILRNWTAGDLGSVATALGVVVYFLATHPAIQDDLRNGPSTLAPAIDEMLRIDDPFLVNRRLTAEAVAVGGYVLPAGTRVYLNWSSANRDEAVFQEPDAYRPDANASHNVVYGSGIHVCPGRPLATMELAVAVESMLAATSGIELAPEVPPVRETYPVGGWRHVPIRLH